MLIDWFCIELTGNRWSGTVHCPVFRKSVLDHQPRKLQLLKSDSACSYLCEKCSYWSSSYSCLQIGKQVLFWWNLCHLCVYYIAKNSCGQHTNTPVVDIAYLYCFCETCSSHSGELTFRRLCLVSVVSSWGEASVTCFTVRWFSLTLPGNVLTLLCSRHKRPEILPARIAWMDS